MPLIVLAVLIYIGWHWLGGSGCEEYASQYSCSYVREKATYDVYYWFDVREGDPKDDRYIGAATGLTNCRNLAVAHHSRIESFRPWSERSYICVLMKDGRPMEKHRL